MEFGGNCTSFVPGNSNRTHGHTVLLPYPTQGHIKPFMKLSHLLSERGIKATVVIPKFIYPRIISEVKNFEIAEVPCCVNLVSAPDGLETGDDLNDERNISERINNIMPGYVEGLIERVNNQPDNTEKVTCVITDVPYGWALGIARKFGLQSAIFFTSAPGILAMTVKIPEFLESCIINVDGSATRDEKVELSPFLPPLATEEFAWNFPKDPLMQKMIIFYAFSAIGQSMKATDWILCNWFHDLEPSISSSFHNVLPIGPLIADTGKSKTPSGNIYSEDLTCIRWLDRRPPGSVIYIAFGSSWTVNQSQLTELALGLELSNRPFLWVIRPDMDVTLPDDGFIHRTSGIGKIVKWAPQEAVLAHPAVACHVSHCSWNSTVEAITMGVPMLCWPSCMDQIYNKSCVCEGWKIGLWMKPGEDGTIGRFEIKEKIDRLVQDEDIKTNAKKWKELAQMSLSEGGSSWKNLRHFVDRIKGC